MRTEREPKHRRPLDVVTLILDETKFGNKDDAMAAAKRFDASAAEALANGETDRVYRTKAAGRSVRVEYRYGEGKWQQPG